MEEGERMGRMGNSRKDEIMKKEEEGEERTRRRKDKTEENKFD